MTTHGIQFGTHAAHGTGPFGKPGRSAHHARHRHAATPHAAHHAAPHTKRAHAAGGGGLPHKVVTAADRHDQLVTQAQKWVSQTFYGELLKQSHNSPFKDKLFGGGRGGEAFGSMFDQQVADRMSRGAGGKMVDSIVGRIEARERDAAAATGGRS